MTPSEFDSQVEAMAGATRPTWSIGRLPLPSLHLRVSERKLMLYLLDLLLLNAALVLSVLLRPDLPAALLITSPRWYVTLSLVWTLTAVFFDLYNLHVAGLPLRVVPRALAAGLTATGVYTLIPVLTPALGGRIETLLFVGVGTIAVTTWRLGYARFFVQPWFSQNALIVGAGFAGRELAAAVTGEERGPEGRRLDYNLVGYIDANAGYWGAAIGPARVLGGHDRLLPAVKRLDVHEVVVAITERHSIQDDLLEALIRCSEMGVRVTTMDSVYERLLGRVPVEHMGRDLTRLLAVDEAVAARVYAAVRRLCELLLTLPVLLVLAVATPLVLLANAIWSPGPLFYRQERIGKGGRPFQIIKFRSMVPNAELSTGPVWATRDDPRITPMGRWMRRTRLDELPQVVNILRGEMSFIGPRPERPRFVEELAQQVPFYRMRHAVRPGLTGWAQAQYRYGSSVDDARVKLEYDLYYVKHIGPLLDLQILVKTLSVVLQFKGT